MIVEMTAEEQLQKQHTEPLPPILPNGSARKVWLVEGGYCADTKYEEKLAEKQQQHQRLQSMLQMYGYTVILLPIILGFSGTIYNSTVECMQKLGIDRNFLSMPRSAKLLTALHRHAITSLHSTVKLRRLLERNPKNRKRRYQCSRAKPP